MEKERKRESAVPTRAAVPPAPSSTPPPAPAAECRKAAGGTDTAVWRSGSRSAPGWAACREKEMKSCHTCSTQRTILQNQHVPDQDDKVT